MLRGHYRSGHHSGILQYMKNKTNPTEQYAVRPCPYSPEGWAIINLITGKVEEARFFSRAIAEAYMHGVYWTA